MRPAGEGLRHPHRQGPAAGQRIGGKADLSADLPGLVQQPRIGRLPADAEGYQRHRMRMHNRLEVGPLGIDRLVKRKLRRGFMRPRGAPIRPHAHNILPPQSAFVEPCRRDPDVTVGLANGQIAARGGRHAVAVNPLRRPQDVVSWVYQVAQGAHVK